MRQYFSDLVERFGDGWNRFWFNPSNPATLGLIRLLTGLTAIVWYLAYLPDWQRFFGPDGLLPASDAFTLRGERGFSIFDYLTGETSLWVGYGIGLVLLVLFTAGVFSRVTAILSWLLVLSTIQRGPVLAGPLEDVLAVLMLYLCVGPSGAAFSVDRWIASRRASGASPAASELVPSWSATVALRLMQLHVTAMYFLMALAKMKYDVWWSGEAVWWLSARGTDPLVDLTGLADNMYVLNAWTHAIVAFQLGFALLVWNRLFRPLVLAIAVPMWLLIAVATDLYVWSALMMVASLSFIPGAWIAACARCCTGSKAERLTHVPAPLPQKVGS